MAAVLGETVLTFGGVDIVINTAAVYPIAEPFNANAEARWAEDAADQRHREHASGGRSGQGAETAGPGGDDRPHELGQRARAEAGSEAYDVSRPRSTI